MNLWGFHKQVNWLKIQSSWFNILMVVSSSAAGCIITAPRWRDIRGRKILREFIEAQSTAIIP